VSGAASPADYEIRVEGVLDQRWTAWFEGLEIDSDQSQTVIWGPVADQAALHGLLNRVCDLGLVIVSVRRLDPGLTDPGSQASSASTAEIMVGRSYGRIAARAGRSAGYQASGAAFAARTGAAP
jgi:hypothetical protein